VTSIEPKKGPSAQDCLRLVNQFPWLPIGLFAGTAMLPNMKIAPPPAVKHEQNGPTDVSIPPSVEVGQLAGI
jgi:hypothetical protein